MKDVQSLVNHLVAGVRKETVAGERTLALLERQQRAVIARDHRELAASTRDLTQHFATATQRSARRDRVLAQLGAAFGVPASLLSLRSVAERVDVGAEVLLEERSLLRGVTARVARESRKTAALLHLHRRVVREVLDLFLTDGEGQPVDGPGTLVNAEA